MEGLGGKEMRKEGEGEGGRLGCEIGRVMFWCWGL